MLTLRYHGATRIPVEAECITPDNLAGKTAAQVERLPVQHGNAAAALAEFFDVRGDAGDGEVHVEGDCGRVKRLGAGMTGGRLVVHGDAGMHLGAEMAGGALEVHGSAGDWAGAAMRGGLLRVHGRAGHMAGAAYPGSRTGMRGGALLIDGDAGDEVAAGMRRGLVAVGGAAGAFAAAALVAGSVFLFGPAGGRPGAGMKRGTVAFLGGPPELLGTFRPACVYEPVFVRLYLRQLRAWGFAVEDRFFSGAWRRCCGDRLAGGKGEILVWQERP
jgi:formylmethanofuran dehydrogenase subunit C